MAALSVGTKVRWGEREGKVIETFSKTLHVSFNGQRIIFTKRTDGEWREYYQGPNAPILEPIHKPGSIMDIPAELAVVIADLKAIQATCEAPHWTPPRRWNIQTRAIDARKRLDDILKAYKMERGPIEHQLIAAWDDGYRQGQEDLKTQVDRRRDTLAGRVEDAIKEMKEHNHPSK